MTMFVATSDTPTAPPAPKATDPRALRYSCSVCGHEIGLHSLRCSFCEARIAAVKCDSCGHIAPADRFRHHVCPQCGIAPAVVAGDPTEIELDPDGRPMDGRYVSRTGGVADVDSLVWLAIVAVGFFVAVPAFASALDFQPLALALKWGGIAIGGAIGFAVGWATVAATWRPRRYLVYVAMALAWLAMLVDHLFPIGL